MGGKWGCIGGSVVVVFGLWFMTFMGCKPIPPTQPDDDLPDGFPVGYDHLLFAPNDFQVRLTRHGEMYNGVWNNAPVVYMAGLWVGGLQQGIPRGNITWIGTSPYSNFTARWDSTDVGIYRWWPEHTTDPTYVWPTAFGAPTDASGNRIVYGDEMAWSAMQSDLTHTTPAGTMVPQWLIPSPSRKPPMRLAGIRLPKPAGWTFSAMCGI